jgi:hypothetical protein
MTFLVTSVELKYGCKFYNRDRRPVAFLSMICAEWKNHEELLSCTLIGTPSSKASHRVSRNSALDSLR